ncbi:hypothetical protein [Erwinia amylovora]|uniref:hypothetical protein n=2 Tax=Erwinia amylovora TaxID=552 RepID=UPI001443ED30|nr:hypothetical protein [Erwinia amylovora]
MKTLSHNASFSEASRFAKQLGLELSVANIGFELWQGESYRGGFTCLTAAIDELNLRYELREADTKEIQQAREALHALLASAEVAAVMEHGSVIGSCLTTANRGGTVAVFDGETAGGAPVNVRHLRISRSAKNLASAGKMPDYTPHLFNGEIYYVS